MYAILSCTKLSNIVHARRKRLARKMMQFPRCKQCNVPCTTYPFFHDEIQIVYQPTEQKRALIAFTNYFSVTNTSHWNDHVNTIGRTKCQMTAYISCVPLHKSLLFCYQKVLLLQLHLPRSHLLHSKQALCQLMAPVPVAQDQHYGRNGKRLNFVLISIHCSKDKFGERV